MSGMFQILEGEVAVIREGGVYKEVQLAIRNNGELYVKSRGGFVRLYADGSTSIGSKCQIDTLALDMPLYKDRFGKLCVSEGENRKPIEGNPGFLAIEGSSE